MQNPGKNIVKRLSVWAIIVAAILMIPLLAQFPWTLSDFIVMVTLIFGTGLMYELITKTVGKKNRLIVGIFLAIVFLLIWAELAVGLIGTPFAGF